MRHSEIDGLLDREPRFVGEQPLSFFDVEVAMSGGVDDSEIGQGWMEFDHGGEQPHEEVSDVAQHEDEPGRMWYLGSG